MFGGRPVHYQLSRANRNDGGGSRPRIGSILCIVYLLCDFLLLHLGRGAQEGLMVSTPSKTPVHPNKSCIVAHFPVSAASHFQPEGVLSLFLKVISLHVSDPLIPLSGVGVAASLMDMLSTSCCWYSIRVQPDGAVAKKHL